MVLRFRSSMIATVAAIVVGVFNALPVFAQATMDYGMNYAEGIGLPSAPIQTIITGFLRAILGFVGFAMVLQIMYAGFLMMTHGGKEEAREKAVAALTQSVVGFLIIATATSTAKFVVDAVVNAQNGSLYS